MGLLFLILILLCPIEAKAADPWTSGQITAELGWGLLHSIDWAQTRQIAGHPDQYHEHNPIFGKHPSTGKVDLVFLGAAVLHPLITHFLPGYCREWWLGITIGATGACVVNNFVIGVRF